MALAAAVVTALAVARPRRLEVVGASMQPTLDPGDRVLAVRAWSRPRPGQVVVVADPRAADRLVVKRVASVSEARVTVLGDNPDASTDSRAFGAVPVAGVRGRVVYRYQPSARRGRVGRRPAGPVP